MSLDSHRKPLSLTSKIFIALLLGAVTGSVLHYWVPAGPIRDDLLIDGVFVLAGNGFMRLLQMLVAPLVFFALASGILSMGEGSSLGKIGIKTIVLFIVTTAAAIALPWVLR